MAQNDACVPAAHRAAAGFHAVWDAHIEDICFCTDLPIHIPTYFEVCQQHCVTCFHLVLWVLSV